MNCSKLLATLSLITLLGGCAHPISMTADVSKLQGAAGPKSPAKVGMVFPDELRKQEVTSPGGGGDKVRYLPYRDLEAGIYSVLSERFASVSKITGTSDAKVQADGLNYLITPTITTTSFSPSIVTWPPTVFTVELACRVSDATDKTITELRVQGEGRAEFDEFKSDFSLAAKRAADEALRKLAKALQDMAPRLN